MYTRKIPELSLFTKEKGLISNAKDSMVLLVKKNIQCCGSRNRKRTFKDHPQPYNLGECEFHLAFKAEDYEAAYKKHKEMGCICFENEAMGIYFIVDPDGYWLEILP